MRPQVEEKTSFDIKLEKFDAATKIKLIKEVRAYTGLGLKEAKELVEKAPADIRADVPKEEVREGGGSTSRGRSSSRASCCSCS